MEASKAALVLLLLLLTDALCRRDAEPGGWRRSAGQDNWPDDALIQDIIVRLTRNQGTRHYVGVTGKKVSGKTQKARKRHKFQTFVGLMGKRSFEDGEATFSAED